MIRSLAAVCVVVVGVAYCVPAVAQDLRVQFGTENLEAVRSIQRGLQASSAGKHKDATAAFQDAIRLDSACGFAYFQLANAQGLLGDLDESIATYKRVFTVGAGCGASIRSVAATNLGLILAQLGTSDEANRWFTRAILEDHQNQFKERGKSYRNLSLSLQSQKRPLAAALAVAMAYEDKARNCDIEMVREFFRRIGNSEVARVLSLDDEAVALKYRGEAAALEPLDIEGRISEQVREMLPDPQGRYVAAMPDSGSHYYLIRLGDASIVQKIESAPTLGACLVEGSLYVSRTNPDRIDQVDVETGKTLKTFAFGKPAPRSFAVFPAHNRIFFPSERIVHQFDMKSGKITETNVPGQAVCGHPTQQFVFSYIKPERDSRSGYVVIDGRLFQVDRGFDWIQSTLFKSIVTPSGLLMAEARDNVASNGSRLVLGQDGNWAAVVGGGGYRPIDKSSKGGYGVALFDSRNFEKLQGFFPTEAYPTGCCVNPVTGSVVTIRDADFRCYAMNSAEVGKVHAGKWNGVSTWSGDGRILLVGRKDGGVAAFGTRLTKEEEALASKWPESVKVAKLVGSDSPLRLDAEPIAALKDFGVPDKVIAEDVRKALQSAIANGRTARTVHWAEHLAYSKETAAVAEITSAIQTLRNGSDEQLGITLYKLRKVNEKTPNHPPLQFFLAEVQSKKNLRDEAAKGFQTVVRGDAGQTDITLLALQGLAIQFAEAGDDLKAILCWIAALRADKANPKTIAKLTEALKKAKLESEAGLVAKLESAAGPSTGRTERAPLAGLPALAPSAASKKLDGESLYAQSAPSVVVIKTREGSGSGVCIGRHDIIVTNAHVVEGSDTVDVNIFAFRDKTLARQVVERGKVVYRSETNDLAIVQLSPTATKLTPMLIAANSPKTGARIYALGSPGLGREVLEQSISEGIVSSADRKLDGKSYIQHTSAVNPGNSGGPLLDEYGRLVGIVTLKAKLENVGFAIPVETVQGLFPNSKK